jgi:D-glycero-alpha-D-manno-heptose-7-phosphate kinase
VVRLKTRAPTRIDLAGGTLDIWPIYLLIDNACTVNVAIDLYAEATFETGGSLFRVREESSGREVAAASPKELERIPGAEIAGALLQFFRPREPLALATRSLAPPQSGLGASSALAVAIASGLNALAGFPYDGTRLMEVVKNVEARVLGAMTGAQDHYPGLYGGAACLWWEADGVRREAIPLDGEAFGDHFVLAYTHQPHRSGANNWEVIKRFLDGDARTRRALEAIGGVSVGMRAALAASDWDRMAELLGEEWGARRQLAPAVSSPELEQLLSAALSAGARSGKACGAGGGGSLLLAIRPERRPEIERAVVGAGGQLVPFRVARHGLQLE